MSTNIQNQMITPPDVPDIVRSMARTLGFRARAEEITPFLLDFHNNRTEENFGRVYLRDLVKENHQDTITSGRISLDSYSLVFECSKESKYVHAEDTLFRMCMLYNGDGVASLGFTNCTVNVIQTAPRITQLQGEPDRAYALQPVRYERALVRRALKLFGNMGLASVVLQCAKNNTWVKQGQVLESVLRKKYDVTARQEGFNKQLPNGDFVYRF
jgi:hypothetical protein